MRKPTIYESFWQGVRKGTLDEFTEEMAEGLVDRIHFSGPALVPLSAEDERVLREKTMQHVHVRRDSDKLKKLAENPVLHLKADAAVFERVKEVATSCTQVERTLDSKPIRTDPWRPPPPINGLPTHTPITQISYDQFILQGDGYSFDVCVHTRSKPRRISFEGASVTEGNNHFWLANPMSPGDEVTLHTPFLLQLGAKQLTPQDKERIYTDIEIVSDASMRVNRCVGSFGMANRPLTQYSYEDTYGDLDRLDAIIERIRKRTGRDEIRLLDVGGSLGRAAWEAEQRYANLQATNLTVTDGMAMFPVTYVLALGERMPARFHESFDLILSNMAFCYFTFPELGVENCLQALAVGGEAHLSGIDKYFRPKKGDEKDPRFKRKHERLLDLQTKGCITYERPRNGIVKLVKHKPIARYDVAA